MQRNDWLDRIERGEVPHAILFAGPKEGDALSLARRAAARFLKRRGQGARSIAGSWHCRIQGLFNARCVRDGRDRAGGSMLRIEKVAISDIYVPTARRKTLHPDTVRSLAEDILENGMKTPIQVRKDTNRYVLVEGLHRLEAAKWLGESTIDSDLVQARRH